MKKVFRICIAAAFAALLAVSVAVSVSAAEIIADGTCGGENENVAGDSQNLIWTLDSEGTLIISGSGKMYNYGMYYAPWHNYSTSIKKVIVNEGVTSIGSLAFDECTGLASVSSR